MTKVIPAKNHPWRNTMVIPKKVTNETKKTNKART